MTQHKRLHIWLDTPDSYYKFHLTYWETLEAVKTKNIVYTIQTHFCNSKMIYDYGFTLYIHFDSVSDPVIIDKTGSTSTTRKLTPQHNLEKLLFAGEFGDIY